MDTSFNVKGPGKWHYLLTISPVHFCHFLLLWLIESDMVITTNMIIGQQDNFFGVFLQRLTNHPMY